MTMAPALRKFALTAHITSSVGWIGALVAYLVLGVSAATSQDAQTVRAAWIAMELTGWFAIVPLALAALLTGIVMALGTPWGGTGSTWAGSRRSSGPTDCSHTGTPHDGWGRGIQCSP